MYHCTPYIYDKELLEWQWKGTKYLRKCIKVYFACNIFCETCFFFFKVGWKKNGCQYQPIWDLFGKRPKHEDIKNFVFIYCRSHIPQVINSPVLLNGFLISSPWEKMIVKKWYYTCIWSFWDSASLQLWPFM